MTDIAFLDAQGARVSHSLRACGTASGPYAVTSTYRAAILACGLALLGGCQGAIGPEGPPDDGLPPVDPPPEPQPVVPAKVVPPAPGASCVAPPADLVSWWTGESADGANDIVAANHGRAWGSVSHVPGLVGEAFSFNGSSAIEVPDDPSLAFTTELTIELWFNRADRRGWWGLIGKRDGSTSITNYGINGNQDYAGGIGVYFNDPDPSVQGGDDPVQYGFESSRLGSVPSAFVTHHFASTYRQLGNGIEVRMYLDGTRARTDTLPGRLANTVNGAPLTFGASYAGNPPGEGYRGTLDEISLYRRALEDSEIASIYQAGGHGKCSAASPPPSSIVLQLGGPIDVRCDNPSQTITVNILSSATFDAADVDHTSLRLNGAMESHRDKGSDEPRRHDEDVDGDGLIDLVVHFRVGDTDLTCGDTQIHLTGQTYSGIQISGTGSIRTITK